MSSQGRRALTQGSRSGPERSRSGPERSQSRKARSSGGIPSQVEGRARDLQSRRGGGEERRRERGAKVPCSFLRPDLHERSHNGTQVDQELRRTLIEVRTCVNHELRDRKFGRKVQVGAYGRMELGEIRVSPLCRKLSVPHVGGDGEDQMAVLAGRAIDGNAQRRHWPGGC